MTNLFKRAGLAILGLVAVLAYWSFRGGDSSKSAEGIPSQVWGGGAATLAIDVETTAPARFSVTFTERGKQDGRMLETWTKVAAGSHAWTIDVPAQVGGYVELSALDPKVGDHLRFGIRVNDRVVSEQSDTLHEALQSGYAFFIQAHFEDYATADVGDGD